MNEFQIGDIVRFRPEVLHKYYSKRRNGRLEPSDFYALDHRGDFVITSILIEGFSSSLILINSKYYYYPMELELVTKMKKGKPIFNYTISSDYIDNNGYSKWCKSLK